MFRRYQQFGQQITLNGTTFPSGLTYVDLLYDGRVQWHKVDNSEDGRLDLIAWKYFEDSALWWAISLYNNLADPLNDCFTGTELEIPVDFVASQHIRPFTYGGVDS